MALTRDTFNILNLALLAALVFCGESIYTKMTRARFETLPAPDKIRPAGEARTGAALRPFQDYTAIKNRDLFKTERTKAGASLAAYSDLKRTKLKLKLWGTVTDESSRHTYAVIEDLETHNQGLYRQGASIQKGKVKRVTRGAVVLSVAGRDEVLAMASLPTGEPDNINPDPGKLPERRIALHRSLFEQATRAISYTMNPAGLTRHTETDGNAGLLITTLWPGSVLGMLGLRNGDVLTLVAGKPINTAKNVATLFEDLKSADDTAVQIRRKNRLLTLIYDLF